MMYTLTSQPEETAFPHELCFGSFDRRFILRDGAPYLCVWMPEKSLWVEEDAILFGSFLLLGTQEAVYGIRLDSLTRAEFPVNGYFKEFLVLGKMVCVFDAEGIFALDEHLHMLWQNRHLSIDGVLFAGMQDAQTMRISCELDPPGGWTERWINLQNGKELL